MTHVSCLLPECVYTLCMALKGTETYTVRVCVSVLSVCALVCVCVVTWRQADPLRPVQTASHLTSSGTLLALIGLTSLTTGGLLSVHQR